MKLPSVKPDSYLEYALIGLLFGLPYGFLKSKLGLATSMVVLASALIGISFNLPMNVTYLIMAVVMVSMVLGFKYGFLKEGFLHSNPDQVVNLMRKMKNKEAKSSSIEGYEDVKKEKNEINAPAPEKTELPTPFKLGEIPSQVKNGPHIDAGSTLMKAIKSLNPDQINAMTKDTQQLIETQKSLMGMLGTMKPMLNDGKQLMDTFQQMFGQ